tara:strand:+ start:193 stop:927 length:735 start_codon:yes stop_codon:yes gene_type:complete
MEKPDKIKKKRGRKPKNNIIVNNKPHDFDTDKKIDNLILCIKEKKHITNCDKIEGYSDNNYEVNNINNINCIITDKKENNNSNVCWNCCHDFSNHKCFIIDKVVNDSFYVYGHFCSHDCVARYLFDNFNNNELWNKYSLLNFFYNKLNNTKNKKINIAPSKLNLTLFGGNLTIEKYREHSIFNVNDIKILPIIPLNISYYNYENKIKINNSKDLKLYRTNPIISKNNIFNTMNIEKFDNVDNEL